jgi:hypothetical protein
LVTRATLRRAEAPRAITVPRSAGRRPEISARRPILRRAGRAVATAADALRRRSHQFINGDLAVVVPVEFVQRLGGVRDFLLAEDSVAVPIERGDDGRHRRTFAAAGAAARMVRRRRRAFARRRSRGAIPRLLRHRESRRQGEGEGDDGSVVFHGLVLAGLFVLSLCEPSAGAAVLKADSGGMRELAFHCRNRLRRL